MVNHRVGPAELHRGVEGDRKSDEHRSRSDKAVQDGDQLGHRGHLNACGQGCANQAPDGQHRQQHRVAGDAGTQHRCDDRDGHPGNAEQVAASR